MAKNWFLFIYTEVGLCVDVLVRRQLEGRPMFSVCSGGVCLCHHRRRRYHQHGQHVCDFVFSLDRLCFAKSKGWHPMPTLGSNHRLCVHASQR